MANETADPKAKLWKKVKKDKEPGQFRQWTGSYKYFGVDDERNLTIVAEHGDIVSVSDSCAAALDAMEG